MEKEFNTFRVLFHGRKNAYHTIQEISFIPRYIKTYGMSAIRKIIFEFHRSSDFPYLYHNISLCNTGHNEFTVQFYHYYNSFNQLVILHPDDQKKDYHKLIYLLYCQPILNTLLIPYIYPPFTNDLKE